ELLSPLRENIEQFKKTFAESYEKESRERFALDKHIQELVALNQNIGKEAQELSRALRGNSKVQGDWGEMILEGILEKSGLEKGREFVIQESTVNEDGSRLRADVVVNYPDGRCAVIDSKVSLTDYVRSVNADCSEEQKTCLSAHAASVRKHIDELKNKNYQDYIGSRKADFVMMFIPNEGAYIAAMQTDNNLWQYAYDNRVIVISPTHLISVMKLLEQLWQHDRQSRNAVDIAKKAGAMYDKFAGFLTDLSKIRKALDSATLAYDESIKKLDTGKGSILRSAQSLKEMGAKASKSLPEQFDTE
ncbi:MAG: DNA recombination protein RmuC, partial [Muribaculaceae bacterium]|nr:DNA recombination protein RmuC [Muribaculaceae bacterium]